MNFRGEIFHFLEGERGEKKGEEGREGGEGRDKTLTIGKKHSSTKRKVELVIPLVDFMVRKEGGEKGKGG